MSVTTQQKEVVQQSFAQVVPIADQVAVHFYDRLFQLDPTLRPLFGAEMNEQRMKLMQTLNVLVKGLNNLTVLVPVLQRLAVRHVGYGVHSDHYATVGEALLWALEHELGDAFTPEVREAWAAVYQLIAAVMMEATEAVAGPDRRSNQNKRFMARFIDGVMNQQKLELIDRYVADDFVEHVPFPGQGPGAQGLKETIAHLHAAFPDTHWSIDEQVAEGENVVTRFTWTGSHQGDFLGIPATGNAIHLWGVVIDVVRHEKFCESRLIMDMPTLMQQLGQA
ncbi:MAG: ester cyclase [Anaerolineales bacterium]|nr:ester cyclase [Anaerolineales bacterium]